MRLFIIPLVVLLPALLAAEDRLELHDGRILVGTYLGGDADEVRFVWASSEQILPRRDVKRLDLGPPPAGSAPAVEVPTATAAPAAVAVAGALPPVAIAPTAPAIGTFPTLRPGSVIMVSLGQTLDSRTSRVGQRFIGATASDVAIDGVVVLPRGTQVQGELQEARDAGNLFGSSELQVVLTSIIIDNRTLPCVTDAAGVQGSNSTLSTVQQVGAGAAIGGLVDGSPGAWVGTAIGGAVALLSRGEQVRLPAGAVLDFRFVQPFSR